MFSIGILGGSGYTGKYLLQFVQNHYCITDCTVYAKSSAGLMLTSVFPELLGMIEDREIFSIDDVSLEHDAYFIALPHGEALKYVPNLISNGKVVIDLGGDYRLHDAASYKKWYGLEHTSPELLTNKSYGLADFTKYTSDGTRLIANPGCYPTATLLGLLPLTTSFAEAISSISTVAYSGTSGAGKTAKADLLMSEMSGNVRAYNVNAHRHQPEIYHMLQASGYTGNYALTTHLLPIATGIYATSTVFLRSGIDKEALISSYKDCYASSPFVRLRETPPNLTWVTNTNYCDIHVSINGQTVIITSAIDNLIKGASGQAMQNLNKAFGWDQTTGILMKGKEHVSVY